MNQQHLFEPPPEGDPRDEWRTPPSLFNPLDKEFGFWADLSATKDNSLCVRYFSPSSDGLSKPWHRLLGPLWCNPPFSQLPAWVEKAAAEHALDAPPIVMLMPSYRNDQEWFHEHVIDVAAGVRMIRGRTAYGPAAGITASSPSFGSQLVIWRPEHEGPTILATQEIP